MITIELIEYQTFDDGKMNETQWGLLQEGGWKRMQNPWTGEWMNRAFIKVNTANNEKAVEWAAFDITWRTDFPFTDQRYTLWVNNDDEEFNWINNPEAFWNDWMTINVERYEAGQQISSLSEKAIEAVRNYSEKNTKRYTLDQIHSKLDTLTESQVRRVLTWELYDQVVNITSNKAANERVDELIDRADRHSQKYA